MSAGGWVKESDEVDVGVGENTRQRVISLFCGCFIDGPGHVIKRLHANEIFGGALGFGKLKGPLATRERKDLSFSQQPQPVHYTPFFDLTTGHSPPYSSSLRLNSPAGHTHHGRNDNYHHLLGPARLRSPQPPPR